METLQQLRNCRTIVRWMLVWFCLSMGVAIASPMVQPQASMLVCTAAGAVKLVTAGDSEPSTPVATAHTMDCVLCMSTGAPPVASVALTVPQNLTHVYSPVHLALLLWRTTAPTSARDPPHLS